MPASTKFSLPFCALAIAVCLAAVSLLGCGDGRDLQPVSGRVLGTDGVPLGRLQIVFEPIDGSHSSMGVSDSQGEFELSTFFAADGAPAGEYRVAVVELPEDPDNPPPPRISFRYASLETSGLQFRVEKRRPNRFEFQLDSPP